MSVMLNLEWIVDVAVTDDVYTLLQKAGEAALNAEGVKLPCSATVRLCNDEQIHIINKEYRNIDSSTDVLSFPSVNWRYNTTAGKDEKRLKAEYDDSTGSYFLGDIIISVDHARAQAEEYGHSYQREMAYLITHSMFHLMGYDHMEDIEQERMREMEEKALCSIGLDRKDTREESLELKLLEMAKNAKEFSYSIYSHFAVGAALHCTDGRIYTGCNIENASFGLTNCAERTAVFKAISEGVRDFDIIAIASDSAAPWPCGACRQVLNEFAPDIRVLVTWQNHVEEAPLKELLPHGFGPESL